MVLVLKAWGYKTWSKSALSMIYTTGKVPGLGLVDSRPESAPYVGDDSTQAPDHGTVLSMIIGIL